MADQNRKWKLTATGQPLIQEESQSTKATKDEYIDTTKNVSNLQPNRADQSRIA